MVSTTMKMLCIMVAAFYIPGINAVDDESDTSHRRRRELGHHLHGGFNDEASSDSAPLSEPAEQLHSESDQEAYDQAPPPPENMLPPEESSAGKLQSSSSTGHQDHPQTFHDDDSDVESILGALAEQMHQENGEATSSQGPIDLVWGLQISPMPFGPLQYAEPPASINEPALDTSQTSQPGPATAEMENASGSAGPSSKKQRTGDGCAEDQKGDKRRRAQQTIAGSMLATAIAAQSASAPWVLQPREAETVISCVNILTASFTLPDLFDHMLAHLVGMGQNAIIAGDKIRRFRLWLLQYGDGFQKHGSGQAFHSVLLHFDLFLHSDCNMKDDKALCSVAVHPSKLLGKEAEHCRRGEPASRTSMFLNCIHACTYMSHASCQVQRSNTIPVRATCPGFFTSRRHHTRSRFFMATHSLVKQPYRDSQVSIAGPLFAKHGAVLFAQLRRVGPLGAAAFIIHARFVSEGGSFKQGSYARIVQSICTLASFKCFSTMNMSLQSYDNLCFPFREHHARGMDPMETEMLIDFQDSSCFLLHSVCGVTYCKHFVETVELAPAIKMQHPDWFIACSMLKIELWSLLGGTLQLNLYVTCGAQSLVRECWELFMPSCIHFCGRTSLHLLKAGRRNIMSMDSPEMDPFDRPPLPRRRPHSVHAGNRPMDTDLSEEIYVRPPLPRRPPSAHTSRILKEEQHIQTVPPLPRRPASAKTSPTRPTSSQDNPQQDAVMEPSQDAGNAEQSQPIQLVCLHRTSGKEIMLKSKARSAYDAVAKGAGKTSKKHKSKKIEKCTKKEQATSSTQRPKDFAVERWHRQMAAAAGRSIRKMGPQDKAEAAAETGSLQATSKARPKRKSKPAGPPRGSLAESMGKKLRAGGAKSEPKSTDRIIDATFWEPA